MIRILLIPYTCGSPSSGIVGYQSTSVKGGEGKNGIQMAVDWMELVLQEMTSVWKLNFIPECRKYIGFWKPGDKP